MKNISQQQKNVIKEANISGKVKEIIAFAVDSEREYLIVINKVIWYAIRLISYEKSDNSKSRVVSVKRFPDLISFYTTKEEAIKVANEIKSSEKLLNEGSKYESELDEDDIKNILLIGRTGNGKSTLANVISGTNNFRESGNSTSQTKNFQTEIFELEGEKYRVVDSIGIGDTKLSKKAVLYKIAEGIYAMKKGINQIFVVVGNRFTKEEIESFELVTQAMFGKNIAKYITIVRTNFPCFDNEQECEKDKSSLLNESDELKQIIEFCKDIIYVDNPPINREENKLIREKSREKILKHLKERCRENYKIENWDKICIRIIDYMNAKKRWEEYSKEDGNSKIENLVIKNELKSMKKEVLKEVEYYLKENQIQDQQAGFECKIEIPAITKIEIALKLQNYKCCSIM